MLKIFETSVQDSKRSERLKIAKAWSNFQEKPPWMAASANVGGVKGADTMSATGTPSPALAKKREPSRPLEGFLFNVCDRNGESCPHYEN